MKLKTLQIGAVQTDGTVFERNTSNVLYRYRVVTTPLAYELVVEKERYRVIGDGLDLAFVELYGY
ncbi:hypothetical protein J6590_067761 [Homalodisca vitripennis]|nr:hypothetical protein J6590_067761 [Homalodisca vitripennis]